MYYVFYIQVGATRYSFWSDFLYTANDLHCQLVTSVLHRNIGVIPADLHLGYVSLNLIILYHIIS